MNYSHILYTNNLHVSSDTGDFMIKIAERLRDLRKEQHITQQSVADYLGIKVRTYQYYEGNGHRPDYETLVKLADFFDVTADYLLGREEKL